jgi:Tol biopolymer transport system component
VVYIRRNTGSNDGSIYRVSTRGGGEPELLLSRSQLGGDPSEIRISPDGARIAIERGMHEDIFCLEVATRELRRITSTSGNATDPDWNPDGRSLLYVRPFLYFGDRDSLVGIFVVDTETLAERQVKVDGHPTSGFSPRWSPDGKSIVMIGFAHMGSFTTSHVWLLAADGSSLRDLSAGSRRWNERAEWYGGSKAVVYASRDGESSRSDTETRMITVGERVVSILTISIWECGRLVALSHDGTFFVYEGPDSLSDHGALMRRDMNDATGSRERLLARFAD